MANMRVGESGKRLRLATSFNMASNTALSMTFTRPGSTDLTVTPTLETGAVTMSIDGVSTEVSANESVYYDFDTGELDVSGPWPLEFTYTNTGATPDDIFKAAATFTVDP